MTVLRNYQEEGIRLIGEEVRRGHRSVCFVAPTGTGKTLTIGELCRRHVAKLPVAKVLWTAHREELVAQAYDALTSLGLECGVIQATPSRPVNPHRPVQIASIQTLVARQLKIDGVTLLVNDEAHHQPSKTWADVPAYYRARGALVIGATATPIRGDGIGLGELYDALVQPISTREAIKQGYLVPYDLIRPKKKLRADQIAQSPVDAYQKHCPGEKAIVFALHLKAASKFLDEFRAAGVSAVLVSGNQDPTERREAIRQYQDGTVRVLVNVGIATEGFDDPSTTAVILARSIGSIALYIQICGRALRLYPGKTKANLIDLHGSSWAHGAPDDDRDWSLEGEALKKPKQALPESFCPVCGVTVEVSGSVCEFCAIARPELVPPEVANVELVKYAAKLREPPEVRMAYFEKLKAEAAAKGHKKFAPHKKFEAIYGEFPPREWW